MSTPAEIFLDIVIIGCIVAIYCHRPRRRVRAMSVLDRQIALLNRRIDELETALWHVGNCMERIEGWECDVCRKSLALLDTEDKP